MNCELATQLVDAYIDGELDLANSVSMEEHIKNCTTCRQLVAERSQFVQLIQEQLPRTQPSPFLATRVRSRSKLRQEEPALTHRSIPLFAWMGVPTIGLVVALITFTVLHSNPASDLTEEAVSDHIRSLLANHLMDVASTDQHTVKPWFAGKLDYSPPVIDFSEQGYPLVGGRLDILDHRTVAAVIYQRRKHYINLFVWPADSAALSESIREKNGYHVFQWSKSGMNYMAVSELGEKELKEFVQMMKDHLPPPIE